jgi:hypothetical protein
MPDYGGGSDYKKVSGTSGGSGYTTSSQASSGGSKASQRRKKAAKAAEARAARALADQKKTDAAEAAAARAASQPPPASNTIYQTLANTFTPNDGTSYVDGILTNTGATSFADQVLAADDVTAFMPPSFTPANQSPGYPGPSYQNPGYQADADGDGVNDYQRFQQVYNAQSEAAKNDPYGQSTEQGFISSDGRQSVVLPDGSVKTEFIPTGKTSVSTSTAKPITTTGPSTRLPPPRPEISCPTPDMRILMADGSLKVAGELQVGDIVKTAHEDTLEWGDHKVTHKDIVESEVVSLKFENSSIKCSPTHKVYLSNDSKWTEVQDLKEGDVVKVQDGDDTFVSLEKIDSGEVVVLTVEDAHTYIAEGILAHNKTLDPGVTTTTLPPIGTFPLPPQFPQYPGYGGGMMGGIGAFGYSPALMQFESQQGAGQVPYYMAAARNQFNPNLSPAFGYAARNYDILGGSQRIAPRPIEMMSAAERAQIAGIGSNFNTPNYNSPYAQSPPQNEFDFFKNMVSGGMPTQVPTSSSGKGAKSGGGGQGLASLLASRSARGNPAEYAAKARAAMMGMFG